MSRRAAAKTESGPGSSMKATGRARRPRLIPQPAPLIMSEDDYHARLNVLLHTDRCRPANSWVSDGVARPELVWEPARPTQAPTSALGPHTSRTGSAQGMVARIKTETKSSLSLGRGEDSCGVLPAWRTPSPSPARAATAGEATTAVNNAATKASPHVFTISDDEDEEVEVSQLRQSAPRASPSCSPVPQRQLRLNVVARSPSAPVQGETKTQSNDDGASVAATSHHDRRRGRRTPSSTQPPRASSGGSSVLVLSAMPPTKKVRAGASRGEEGAVSSLPRTMDEFLQTDQ